MNYDFAKVCGKHSAIYEAYYKQIDPKATGAIEAMTAAKFLKKSGLSDVVLSRVWDLSDPQGKGFLDKPGFFVALKLVSLAQAGQVINTSNIYTETANPPKVGDLPKIMPPRIQTVPLSSGGVATGDWSIGVIERLKYEQIFESLKPENGMLAGNKVKGVLLDSKLPMDTLGKIWDLADQDKDGNLDKHEFIVAMHLVSQTLEKRTVPNVLPPELRKPAVGGGVPPAKPEPPLATAAVGMPRAPSGDGFGDGGFVANFPKDIKPPPIPPLPAMNRVPPVGGAAPVLISTDPLVPIGAPPSVTANADWVVTPAELKRYEVMFRDSDRDKDGLVSGLEVKGIFLQSGVPQQCLAHIWALCDTNQSGKLTLEQFALAMWMVERKQKGIEPPQMLTANMVPPSMRGIIAGVDVQPKIEPKPEYTNPELEMIASEIEELAKERRALETEIAQKEADIRIKNGEVRSLQSELDTLSATLKQLENQRGEAQKRLDDLQAQSQKYEFELIELNKTLVQSNVQVNKIREQCQKQEETINEQEGELNAKRSELQKLKDEEAALQKDYDDNNKELQKLTKHLQNTQLQISSVRSMVTELLETQRRMTDALLMCRAAIENQDADLVTEYQLKIEPDFDDARKTLEKKIEEPKDDPFGDNANKNSNGFATNGFANDPFVGSSVGISNSISPRGGFDDSFNTTSGFDSGFDAFGAGGGGVSDSWGFAQSQKDTIAADAFGASKSNAITPEPGKDDFGSDPFAALHAPTGQGQVLSPNMQKSGPPPRPESPSPALPPKKSKVPPPRPAPPRPMQAPTRPQTDAFGSSTGTGGFADFADFDNKQTNIPFTKNTITTNTTATIAAALYAFITTTTNTNTNTTTSTTKTTTTFASNNNNSSLFDSNAFGDALSFDALNTTHSISSATLVPSSSATNATTTTTTTTTLFKSNIDDDDFFKNYATTLQPAASNATTSSTSIATNIITGPTDFKDDPFKDYRYEDPFSIKDPFADDDDDEETESEPSKIFNNASSLEDLNKTKQTHTATALNDDFLQQFSKLASTVPSQQPSVATLSKTSDTSRSTTPLNSVLDNFADFDAFSSKSSSLASAHNKPNSRNDNFFDAFNDHFDGGGSVVAAEPATKTASNATLDAFGIMSINNSNINVNNNNNNNNTSNTNTTNSNSSGADSGNSFSKYSKFDDDFNDNFASFDAFGTTAANVTTAVVGSKDVNLNFALNNTNANTNTSSSHKVLNKFDAFGDSNDDFVADFSQALNNSKNVYNSVDNSFAAATVANKLQKVQNQTTLNKQFNKSALNVSTSSSTSSADAVPAPKLPEKFVADYSKPEEFDADLQEAIKRSMMEQ